VVFRMKVVDPFMLQNFAGPYNVIYAAKDIAKPGNWHKDHVNGTGPFVFVEHVSGEKWVAKRYEGYHFDDVYLDGTIAYRIKDVANPMTGGQIMAEFRSVSPPERKNLKEMMGDRVAFQEEPMLSKMMVSLNSKFKPFQDKRVRQALTLCVDRYDGLENLAKITWTSPVASGHLFPGTEWALSPEELEQLPGFGRDIKANRAKARQLLKEAGYDGLEFVYSSRAVSHPYEQIAIFLIAQWKECGFKPTLVSNPTAKWAKMRSSSGFDATIDFNSNVLIDPTLMLQKNLSADRSPQNYSGFIDRKLDALFDAQRKESDPAKRKELVQQFERRVLDESWTVPISFMARTIALNSKVKGYKIAPSLMLNTNWRGVWIDE
jgi:peptide/nickel transport system substrate-binding protein